jgi:phosphoribosylaminoimidazolecarboxamide formyltransferase/IMP cyclohydrolase
MRIALISVYNKEGIVEFAKQIQDLGFKILASGGTAKVLASAGIEVTDVATVVGGSAILGHRVVTLSREIHAGLLARDIAEDRAELKRLNIPFIDLVCVDLYPLQEEIRKWREKTLTRPDQGRDALSQREREEMTSAIIEKTDIGGPTIVRSAAKGRRIVICDPADRNRIVEWLKAGEPEKEKTISELAAKAEFVVANYCLASAKYHSAGKYDGLLGQQILECKYGENAWQAPAGLYTPPQSPPILGGELKGGYGDALSLSQFKLVAGTAPSYNNWADVDRLLQTITHIVAGFDVNKNNLSLALPSKGEGKLCIAVGVKHGNPCGAAVADKASDAIQKMLEGDLRAIFGGVVMVNFEIDEKLAEILLTHCMDNEPNLSPSAKGGGTLPSKGESNKEKAMQRRLLDGIIAPSFTSAAVEMLKRKEDKCRFLVNPALANLSKDSLDHHNRFRYVRGGFLRQPNYSFVLDLPALDLSSNQKKDLVLAWAVGSTSNSNTVTLVKNQMLIGNGVGQQDRVGGCELAVKRAKDAGHEIAGSAAYSDSFFPFVDGVQVLHQAGVTTIFSTSGSVRDEEIKKFCKEHQITLVMLPDSQARGFFGH